ncbi:glycerophosphodiester phosphodiesterase [soil metagenome]
MIGHKGADALAPGNTLESFRAAVDAGVEMIEIDVLRPRDDFDEAGNWRAAPPGPAEGSGPLQIAHDWANAASRGDSTLTLEQALDALSEPPLDRLEFDLDMKTIGREDEVVDALRERGLIERAMTSGMELPTIKALAQIAPELRRGWTIPRVTRDWTSTPWAKHFVGAGMLALKASMPRTISRQASALGVKSIWIFHVLATKAIVDAAHDSGCELICWTVDDAARMHELAALGVDGICSNDPRLFAELREANPTGAFRTSNSEA